MLPTSQDDPNAPSAYTVWDEHREVSVYRASALGACSKLLIASRLGYENLPPPPAMKARFDQGHKVEKTVLDDLVDKGWTVHSRQLDVTLAVSDGILIRGHIDALVTPNSSTEYLVADVKMTNQEDWDGFAKYGWDYGLFPRYKWQFSVYMLALNKRGILLLFNRDSGEYLWYVLTKPFYSISEIRTRVLLIESLARQGELPKLCDLPRYPCPVFYLHEGNEEEERIEIADPELAKLAVEYEEARIAKKIADEKVKKLAPVIRDTMTADRCSLPGNVRVSKWQQNNPPRLNEEKMIADGIDVNKYREQTKSWRLKVMLPKPEPADEEEKEEGKEEGE